MASSGMLRRVRNIQEDAILQKIVLFSNVTLVNLT
jgi:hypothetical protein